MSESLALFGKYINMMFTNVFFKMWKLKAKNVFTSVIVPPIGQFAPNLAQEPLDDFRNNQLKFDVESIYFDRHMKQYVFFS